MPRLASTAFAAVLALTVGCASHGGGSPDAPPPSLEILDEGTRLLANPHADAAALRAFADKLATAAASEGGTARGVSLGTLAGELRLRVFRASSGSSEPDARAALAAFATAGKRVDLEACRPARLFAELSGEIAHDPGVTYQELYVARRRFHAAACVDELEQALVRASPFRPPPTVLEQLDRALTAEGVPIEDAGIAPPKSEARPRVSRLSRWTTADTARVVIELDRAAAYALEPASGGGVRLRIDGAELPSLAAGGSEPTLEPSPPKSLLLGGGLAKTDGGLVLTLSLARPAYRRVFFLPDPFRIVVDLGTQPPVFGVASGPRPLRRVVVDPGHGGADPGAIGPTGLREKDVTIAIAKMVGPILARELGVEVRLTRGSDAFVSLEERAAVGNAFEADVFVSIHCNAAETKARRGIETYVLDTARDELAHRVAKRENGGGAASHGELRAILDDLKIAEVGARSHHLATLLQKATMSSLHAEEKGVSYGDVLDGGVHGAGFFVLVGARMPAVLMEVSFISNPIEEGYLAKTDYRARVADAIVNALRAYRDGK
ncbi:MAG: N-acetylmuramoyl-L-alanine amidase [Myxococcales bacterium]|nr:N-acetylmuramoyl-L-alanine amidase [Myxococcales bacterium]